MIGRTGKPKVFFVREATYDAEAGYTRPKRTTIGYVCEGEEQRMHLTTGYKQFFPRLWEEEFGERAPAELLHVGMRLVEDAVDARTGLKTLLKECLGEGEAQAVLDLASREQEGKELKACFEEAGIEVCGLILRRGPGNRKQFHSLRGGSLPYILQVGEEDPAFLEMLGRYGKKIWLNVKYLVENTELFAAQCQEKLLEGEGEESLTLFCDPESGGRELSDMLDQLNQEMKRMEREIAQEKRPLPTPPWEEVLSLSGDEKSLEVNQSMLQEKMDKMGYRLVASSKAMEPALIGSLYFGRELSETGYHLVERGLGGKGPWEEAGRFLAGFVAALLKYDLILAAEPLELTYQEVIREANQLILIRAENTYISGQNEYMLGKELKEILGLEEGFLDRLAREVNERLAGRGPHPGRREKGI